MGSAKVTLLCLVESTSRIQDQHTHCECKQRNNTYSQCKIYRYLQKKVCTYFNCLVPAIQALISLGLDGVVSEKKCSITLLGYFYITGPLVSRSLRKQNPTTRMLLV